jgi:hypothetical protein
MTGVHCNLLLLFHCDYSMGSVGEMIWEKRPSRFRMTMVQMRSNTPLER